MPKGDKSKQKQTATEPTGVTKETAKSKEAKAKAVKDKEHRELLAALADKLPDSTGAKKTAQQPKVLEYCNERTKGQDSTPGNKQLVTFRILGHEKDALEAVWEKLPCDHGMPRSVPPTHAHAHRPASPPSPPPHLAHAAARVIPARRVPSRVPSRSRVRPACALHGVPGSFCAGWYVKEKKLNHCVVLSVQIAAMVIEAVKEACPESAKLMKGELIDPPNYIKHEVTMLVSVNHNIGGEVKEDGKYGIFVGNIFVFKELMKKKFGITYDDCVLFGKVKKAWSVKLTSAVLEPFTGISSWFEGHAHGHRVQIHRHGLRRRRR